MNRNDHKCVHLGDFAPGSTEIIQWVIGQVADPHTGRENEMKVKAIKEKQISLKLWGSESV